MKRLALLLLLAGCAEAPRLVVLGTPGEPEWEDLGVAAVRETDFEIQAAAGPHTIVVYQDNVRHAWSLELNGRPLGRLQQMEVPLLHPVQADAVQGLNVLSVKAPKEKDDVRVGVVRVVPKPLADWLAEAVLEVRVVESPRDAGVPARITVVDEATGALAPLAAAPGQQLAVRTGCVYTGTGLARLTLPAGRYRVSAGRGFEYSIDRRAVALREGDSRTVELVIRREVPTPLLAACDTHLHTKEFSGHGDATAVERALTLAGEGIELAVCTEHNQHRSYAEAVRAAGVASRLTTIDGNEVTTPKGHFNVFPVAPGAPVPDAKETDWPRLLAALRATPGVKAVILNHPRNLHTGFIPFAPEHYDAVTGENLRGFPFAFDAIELLNSSALRTDDLLVFRDWLALLNGGTRAAGVGSSDCHEVNRYIAGQGRTYVEIPDADPAALDPGAAAAAVREGRSLVSLGLLTTLKVDGRGPGSTVKASGATLAVDVSVWGPSWTKASWMGLYVNGVLVRQEELGATASVGGEKARRRWEIPRPAADAHVVALATGPGVTDLHWPLSRPYQPDSPAWSPKVIGIANPVWVDADGDGRWSPPRETAAKLVEVSGGDVARLLTALAPHDEAVATQAAAVLRALGRSVDPVLLAGAPEAVRRGIAAVRPR